MSEFDSRAREWDNNPIHWERSEAIAQNLLEMIPVSPNMKALEYGAGSGILSFLLSNKFSEVTLMDNSKEMVTVMHEKVQSSKIKNLKPLLFDMEHSDYHARKFDCVFSQMVLHHVTDTEQLLNKFYQILSPNGYLAIADLYPEDGSFHGEGFTGHKGFDVADLQAVLERIGFTHIATRNCFTIKKTIGNSINEFPIFLLIVTK
jgi:ubiquinone/menaquinone biosynthesis C-methylase UbiE